MNNRDKTREELQAELHYLQEKYDVLQKTYEKDISESKRSLEILRESEEIYRMHIENSSDVIFTLNEEGVFTFISPSWILHFGYSINESIGKSFREFVHPDDEQPLNEYLKRLFVKGQRETSPAYRVREINGNWLWFVSNGALYRDKHGNKLFIGIGRDITERKLAEESLRASEAKYRLAVSASRLGTWDWDIITSRLNWSDACKTMFGIPLDIEMRYEHFLNAVHPDDRKPANDKTWISLNEKADYDFEYRVLWPNSSIHWIRALGCGIYDETGKPVRMLGVAMDITEQKHAEDLLRESEASFRAIFEGAPDAIVLVDTETRKVISVNNSAARLFAKPAAEIVGMAQHQLHPPQIIEYTKTTFEKHLEESQTLEATHPIEDVILCADGRIIPVEILAKMIRLRDQNVLMGTFRDITERKNAEKALKDSEKNFRELFEANSDGITLFAVNPYGPPSTIIDLNENAAKMLGYTKEEMLKMNPKFLEKDVTLEIVESRKNDLSLRGYSSFETVLLHKDGHEINVEIKIIHTLYNSQLAILNIARDITARKTNEIQLQKHANELAKLNADKDRFLSILAHDLKSPFNTILGFLALLSKNIRKYEIEKVEDQIEIIYQSAQRTYQLMDELLIWASSQSNAFPFEVQKLNLHNICKEVEDSLQLAIKAKEIVINCTETTDILVFADKEMLKTILRNLISNAIKYSYPQGSIDILASKSDSQITISVADKGTGIANEKLNSLFDIAQIHSTKGTANETGTGLGLLICKEFIEKHGGRIWAESELGEGTQMHFTLLSKNLYNAD